MGRWHCSRPWPVLRDGASRLLRTRLWAIADLMVRSARSARLEPWAAGIRPAARMGCLQTTGNLQGRMSRQGPAAMRRPGFRCAPSGLRRRGARRVALMKKPDAFGPRRSGNPICALKNRSRASPRSARNSKCGFSPIIFSQGCQKERCQRVLSVRSCVDSPCSGIAVRRTASLCSPMSRHPIQCASRINPTNFIEWIDNPTA